MRYQVTKDSHCAQAGAGLQAASTVRWNDKTDGKMSVMWESQTVLVLATVFWLAV